MTLKEVTAIVRQVLRWLRRLPDRWGRIVAGLENPPKVTRCVFPIRNLRHALAEIDPNDGSTISLGQLEFGWQDLISPFTVSFSLCLKVVLQQNGQLSASIEIYTYPDNTLTSIVPLSDLQKGVAAALTRKVKELVFRSANNYVNAIETLSRLGIPANRAALCVGPAMTLTGVRFFALHPTRWWAEIFFESQTTFIVALPTEKAPLPFRLIVSDVARIKELMNLIEQQSRKPPLPPAD